MYILYIGTLKAHRYETKTNRKIIIYYIQDDIFLFIYFFLTIFFGFIPTTLGTYSKFIFTLTRQREHGQFAGKRTYETGHVAHGTSSPVRVVDEVHAAIVPVDYCDYKQIRPHEEIAKSQVDD